MNKIIIFSFLSLIYLTANSQSEACGEIGVLLGSTYYLGELNKTPFTENSPAGAIFYRHTFNKRYALRGLGNLGLIKGEGNTIDGYPVSFNNFFADISTSGEYNFLEYLPAKKNYKFSPYIHAGIGIMYYPEGIKKYLFNIPFGVGVKFNFDRSKRWSWGVDYTMRKIFDDNIDYQYDIPNPKQSGYIGNTDWVSFLGINLSYKIEYKVKCPAIN